MWFVIIVYMFVWVSKSDSESYGQIPTLISSSETAQQSYVFNSTLQFEGNIGPGRCNVQSEEEAIDPVHAECWLAFLELLMKQASQGMQFGVSESAVWHSDVHSAAVGALTGAYSMCN
jgi:hypothetical protein